jgi:hypothetical protein
MVEVSFTLMEADRDIESAIDKLATTRDCGIFPPQYVNDIIDDLDACRSNIRTLEATAKESGN